MNNRKALVIGASGLIGRSLVFELLKSDAYDLVVVLSRKDLVIKHPKLEQHLIDFDFLADYSNHMQVDDVFCCMGSTQSKTPNLDAYRKIDYTYPLQVATIAKEQGATQFLLVSSLNYQTYRIFRPSLLLGARNESRPLETISQYLMRVLNIFFIGPAKKYKAIQGTVVAKAMLKAALLNKQGNFTHQNDKIFELAGA